MLPEPSTPLYPCQVHFQHHRKTAALQVVRKALPDVTWGGPSSLSTHLLYPWVGQALSSAGPVRCSLLFLEHSYIHLKHDLLKETVPNQRTSIKPHAINFSLS